MAGQLDGQLWFVVQGGINDIIDGHLNADGSNITTVHLNPPATPGTGFQQGGTDQSIGLDLPDGLYFVVNSDGLSISVHNIITGALIDTLQIGDFNGSVAAQDIVNSLVVDPNNHVVYVGRWGETKAESGIVAVSYTTAGDLDNNQAYNVAQTRLVDGTDPGGITDVRYMDLSNNNQILYYTDNDNNYSIAPFSPTNGVYKIDLTNPAAGATLLSSQVQFPANLSNGLIGTVTADEEDGIIYFTTHQFSSGGASTAQDALWWMPIAGGTATKITLPANALHYAGEWGGLSYDRQTGQLWISDVEDPTSSADRHIVQLQMSADGKSVTSVVATYTVDQLVGHTADANAYPQGTMFDLLPIITVTGTTTHAAEQVATPIDLTSGATSITDADNSFLASATVQITGGTFVSNETSANDDHLSVNDGGVFKTTGTFTGTSITISYDSATEKLTLSGVDTLAHYQTVLNAVSYNTTGDNPTNYGNNATRTITWTASDGAPNVPDGGQNQTTTTLNIDAKNDAPVNHLPATPSIDEDVQTPITGLSFTDVDADPANQDITVQFTVQHGTLNVLTGVAGGITGADITAGAQNTATITLTATQNQINATIAANGLRYTSDSNYYGPDTLDIVTNDNSHTDSAAFPGAQTDTDDLSITVNPVNDPVTGTTPASAVVDEDQSVAVPGMSIADVDTVLAPNGVYEVTLSATNGTATLTTLSGLTFTAGDGTSDATMTFHGTLANINTAIATASYAPASNYNGAATLTLFVTDTFSGTVATGSGAATSDTDVVNVTVNPVNDPISTTAPATASLAEDSVNFAVTGMSIADVDATLAPAGVYEVTLSATHGVLTLTTLAGLTFTSGDGTTDTTMTFHGTLSSINTALATAKYSPDANYNGSAQITLQATDTFGGIVATGSGSATSDSDTINVTVTAVNDPVAGTAPANVSATEDGGSVAVTGLSISDVDATLAPAGVYSVTLTASQGTLTLSTTTGLTFDTGDGSADATMTFHGTLSDINTAVATATYAPNANFNGSDTIVFSVTDTFGGIVATGSGAATSDSDNISVTVSAVNDPVSTNAPATATLNEDSVNFAVTGMSIADVDATLAPAGVYEVTLSATHGVLTLTTTTGLTFTSGDGLADTTMTFHGTLSNINNGLGSAKYSPDANYNGPAQITLQATDTFGGIVATGTGSATSDSDTINVTVTSLNDAPVVAPGGPLVYTENDPASGIMGGGGTVTDVDSADFNGGSLTVSFGANARAADQLSILTDSTILLNGTTVQYDADGAGGNPAVDIGTITTNGANGANLVVSFNTANATAAATTALIQHVAYANSSDNPVAELRLVTFSVNDGDGTANGGVDTGSTSANLTVVAKNDAPVSTITPTSYSGSPNVSINLKNNGLSVSDVDGNNGSETVTLFVTSGTLTVTAGTSGAGVAGSGTNSVQITGTIAQINDLLNTNGTSSVGYVDTTGGTKTLTLAINDNGNTGTPPPGAQSAQDTANIVLDNPPVVDLNGADPGTGATLGYTENAAATAIAPAGVTTDTDSSDFNGGALRVSFSANGAAEDQLSILTDGTVTVSSGTVSVGGLAIGTVSGGANGTDLLVNFNTTNATPSTVSTLIEHIGYANNSDNPSTAARTVTFLVDDGDGASGTANATINITPVNDAPVATITPTTYSATEQTSLSLKNTNMSVSDVDGNAGSETVTLSVAEGTLTVTAGGSGAVVNNSGTSSVTITGTIAQINALLNTDGTSTVSYIDNTNDPSASATLTLLIHDNGNTGGGDLSNQDTATINITSVNDAPGLSNVPATADYTENAAPILFSAAFPNEIFITDPDPVPHGAPGGNGLILTATAKIASGFVAGDRLLVDDTSDAAGPQTSGFYTGINIQWNYDATTHVLTLSNIVLPPDTMIDFDHVLDNVYFDSTSDDPTNGGANTTRTIEWQVQDAGGTANGGSDTSAVYTTTLTVHATNDAPVATITPTSYSATEQVSLNLKNNGLAVSDVDGGGGSETVTLSVGEGVLNVTTGGSGATVNNSGTATVTITGTAAQINALLNTDGTSTVSYIDNTDTPGASTTLTLLIHDNGNTGTGGDLSSSDSATINITAVNDAPVFSNLGGLPHPTFVENGSDVVMDNNVTVSDVELNAAGGSYGGTTLTLVNHLGANPDDTFAGTGTLDLTDVNGNGENVSLDNGATFIGTFTQPGDGTFSITFNANATAADVASVMQQIVYGNASDNPPSSAQIDWSFNDGNTGSQGTGGAGIATGSVTVDITQVDDAPVLLNVAPTAAYSPGSSGVVLSSALGVFDIDATPPSPNIGIHSATIKIESGFFAGDQLFVNLPTSGGFFIVDDGSGPVVTNISVTSNAAGTMVLGGTDTTLHYQLVLDTVNYRSTAADPSNGGLDPTRNISWQVNDGVLNSQTPNPDPNNLVNETVLHFDVAPAVDLDASGAGTGFTTTFTENGAPIAIVDTDVSIVDPDNSNLDTATIVLTNAKATDVLSIAGALPGGIDGSIDNSVAGQITIHLSNSASIADYQTALGQIRFVNSSDAPNTTDRDITVQVSNSADSNVAHATIHVVAVNDAPVAQDGSASGNENTTINGTLHATDPDSPLLTYSRVAQAAHGVVNVNPDGSFSYSPNASFSGTDSFTYKANDGSLDSNIATETITVNSVIPPKFVIVGTPDLGVHPLPYQVAGVGDFNGNGTDDVLWYNPNNGATEEWMMANGQWSQTIGLGSHGAQVAGVGDFNHDGTDDVLWRNPTTGALDEWVMHNGQWAGSIGLGNHGTDWQVAGVGDFNADGTDDVLFRNSNTGQVDLWLMQNGQWSSSVGLGSHGTAWQVAGVGDFDANGAADVLWRNVNTGQLEEWLMNNGQWSSSVSLGAHPATQGQNITDWQVAGVGDFNHDGTDDILFREPLSGAMDGWVMHHGQWAGSAALPAFDPQSHVAGIGNFNGAGGDDVLWHNATNGHTSAWLLGPG